MIRYLSCNCLNISRVRRWCAMGFPLMLVLFFSATVRAQTPTPTPAMSPAAAQRIIAERTRQVVGALRQRDMQRLATFVHPMRGVRFSPYVSAQPNSDRRFTRAQLLNAWRSRRRFLWGEQDGSGDPIRLTFRRYFAQYVYDKDFARVTEVSYNTIGNPGTLINNLLETYPQAIFVSYFHPGSDPRYGGMDWRSLWLVYEQHRGTWYLVGIAHGEWTT